MKDVGYIIGFPVFGILVSAVVALLVNVPVMLIKTAQSAIAKPVIVIEHVPAKFQPIKTKNQPVKGEIKQSNYTPKNEIEEEIKRVFGYEWLLALSIAKAESGLNPQAVNYNRNGTKDVGVFQINDCHNFSDSERFDWRTNVRLAKLVRDTYGWTAWVTYNKGSYKKFYRW